MMRIIAYDRFSPPMEDVAMGTEEKVAVVVDLWNYRKIAEDWDDRESDGVRRLNDQIQRMIDEALSQASFVPSGIPRKHTGDGAIVVMERAEDAVRFAEALHRVSEKYNLKKRSMLNRRHFRIGICQGCIDLEVKHLNDGKAMHEIHSLAVSNASRLEGACATGQALMCNNAWGALSSELKAQWGLMESITDKKGDVLYAYRRHFVAPAPEEATMKSTRESAKKDEPAAASPVEELLKRLMPDSPPSVADVAEAAEEAIKGVSAVAGKCSSKRPITLEGIQMLVAEAIGHGAGIYNGGGRVECGRVYHHAASLILKCRPKSPTGAGGPLRDAALACQWLDRIISATPAVDEANGDDVAWELRFAFDATGQVALLNQIQDAIRTARNPSGKADLHELRPVILGVLKLSSKDDAMTAYILRHAAEALGWSVETYGCDNDEARAQVVTLAGLCDEEDRIHRYNATALCQQLRTLLTELMTTGDGSDKGRSWFERLMGG